MVRKKVSDPTNKQALMVVGQQIHDNMSTTLQKLAPEDRRPLSIGGKTIDLSEVETLGLNGMDERLALKLLKVPLSAMENEPEAAQIFRQSLEYGQALLAEKVQATTISMAIDDRDATMMKFVAGAYGAAPLQTKQTNTTGATSDSQHLLNGLISVMIESRKNELDQQRRAIAEERARAIANTPKSKQGSGQPPILGDINYREGIPECEVVIAAELVSDGE